MRKLLITGFDPFAHYTINPSWEVVKALPDVIGEFKLTKLRLPNIYGLAGRMLLERAEELEPDAILLTGMDSGSTHVHLDCVAVNLRDALVEDNLGKHPWNEPIIAAGPAAYFATMPVHALVRILQRQHLPVHLGYATGGYVCNDIFYLALHHYAAQAASIVPQIAFLHVPLLPEMVWDESLALPLAESVHLVSKAIEELSALGEA
ncbi:MAG: hypothetical protein SO119_03710 [Phascolarctobacterium sp.]|nr:hypothetical protein [Phascolarctobacterium sp.]